jgi:hypothetical protein
LNYLELRCNRLGDDPDAGTALGNPNGEQEKECCETHSFDEKIRLSVLVNGPVLLSHHAVGRANAAYSIKINRQLHEEIRLCHETYCAAGRAWFLGFDSNKACLATS